MDSAFRTDPHWMDRFVLLDFPVETETETKSYSRRHRRSCAARHAAIDAGGSQCASRAIRGCRRHGRCKGTNPPGRAGTSGSGKIRTLWAGEKWNPSVRPARNWENIPGKSDRWRVRAALRIRIRSKIADPLDWSDRREYPGRVRAGCRPQAPPLFYRRDRLARKWPTGRH